MCLYLICARFNAEGAAEAHFIKSAEHAFQRSFRQRGKLVHIDVHFDITCATVNMQKMK